MDSDIDSNDMVTGMNSVKYYGALVVTNIGATPLSNGDTFQLFSPSGTKTGNFSSITILPATGPYGSFAVATGILIITNVTPILTTPTNLLYGVSGGRINLSWSANYLGWSLQVQTNSLILAPSTNWVRIPGSSLVTATNFLIGNYNGSVFYRMCYQP